MADKQSALSYAAWRKAADAGEHPATGKCQDVIFKQFNVDVQTLAERRVKFTITTSAPDRERDVVSANGVDTTNFEKNPVVLFAHDYRSLPVGRCIQLQREGEKIVAVTEFATEDLNPQAERVFRMVKAGFLKAASIGFRPLEWVYDEERRGVNFQKVELLEYSIVPVPANAQALAAASADGIDTAILKEWAEQTLKTLEESEDTEKGVSPKDVSTSKADEGMAWSAPSLKDFTDKTWGDLSASEKRNIAGHYAWAAQMPPDAFGSLKLPHHETKSGSVVWRGVVAAIARMNQAQIPSADMGAVKAHLRRHYKAFRPDADTPDALKSLAPFDADEVGWAAYSKAVERAQKRAGDTPLDDETLANLLEDYGFEKDAEVLRGKPHQEPDAEPDEDEDDSEKGKKKPDQPDTCAPDGDGNCPSGYAMGDDGMCHMKAVAQPPATLGETLKMTINADEVAAMIESKLAGLRSEMGAVEKGGRALSKANEGKLRDAQVALANAQGAITDVLKSVEERADETTSEETAEPVLVLAADEPESMDEVVLDLEPEETKVADAELVEIDAADLMGAIRGALTDVVRRETAAALNALRGKID